MKKNPKNTRLVILNTAQELILENGFGGTTVDAIIEKANVSKGAFFHHFSSKADLGRTLVQRYADADARHLEDTLNKAEALSDDPLQQLLIFVKLFEQEMQILEEPFPGCLFASYTLQSEMFDDATMDLIRNAMLKWRKRILNKIEQIVDHKPPVTETDLVSLADMLLVIFEGSFILSKSVNEAKTVARQLSHYHNYLKLLFSA